MSDVESIIRSMAASGKSKASIKRELGISHHTFRVICIGLADVKFHAHESYEIDGFRGTIKEICKHFNLRISPVTVAKRLREDWDVDDAFLCERKGLYTFREFQGTIQEIIDHFNLDLSASIVRDRIYEWCNVDRAFTTPKKPWGTNHVGRSSNVVPKSDSSVHTSVQI